MSGAIVAAESPSELVFVSKCRSANSAVQSVDNEQRKKLANKL